jgi:Tol biopolymer transport system component
VYVSADALVPSRKLVWVDRAGGITPLTEDRRRYSYPRLSPDGKQVAVSIDAPSARNIWIYDVEGGSPERLTDEGDIEEVIWTPDSKRLTFGAYRKVNVDWDGHEDIYWMPSDGSRPAEPLVTVSGIQWPSSWSPDGRILAFIERRNPANLNYDIWIYPIGGEPAPFVVTEFTEHGAVFSPDGHWLAYHSNESGQMEVYVRAYPGPGGVSKVSTDGGSEPMWSPDGRELFYRCEDQLIAVAVETRPRFRAGLQQVLFAGPYVLGGEAQYSVSPDGQRFLMIEEGGAWNEIATQAQIILVQNWFEELKRLCPTGK